MTELDELIQYWKDNLAMNYVHRSPQANHKVEQTIKYLIELNELHKIQRQTLLHPTLGARR